MYAEVSHHPSFSCVFAKSCQIILVSWVRQWVCVLRFDVLKALVVALTWAPVCCFFLFLVETFVVVGKLGASKRAGGSARCLAEFPSFWRFFGSFVSCRQFLPVFVWHCELLRALFESYASAYFALYPHILLGGVCARNGFAAVLEEVAGRRRGLRCGRQGTRKEGVLLST